MQDAALLLPLGFALAAIGAFAGLLAGLLGVGGGLVLVGAFFYAFQALGYRGDHIMQICLGTSLATIIVTSLRSVLSHHKRGAVEWGILRAWAPGIALGAAAGVYVAALLRTETLQWLFGVLALLVAFYMLLSKPGWRIADTMPGGAARAGLSPLVGFLSVLMGIGGGSFGVPLMTAFGTPVHRAVATAAGFGVIIAVPSVLGFLMLPIDPETAPPATFGAVNLIAFGLVISMTWITTPIGVKLAHALNPAPLKRVFAGFLMVVSASMIWQALK